MLPAHRSWLGLLAGGVLGWLYYRYIGCLTGHCLITGHPVSSTAYFALIGWLMTGGARWIDHVGRAIAERWRR